jgi:hypothetical protein
MCAHGALPPVSSSSEQACPSQQNFAKRHYSRAFRNNKSETKIRSWVEPTATKQIHSKYSNITLQITLIVHPSNIHPSNMRSLVAIAAAFVVAVVKADTPAPAQFLGTWTGTQAQSFALADAANPER